jgi:hypothetical protein
MPIRDSIRCMARKPLFRTSSIWELAEEMNGETYSQLGGGELGAPPEERDFGCSISTGALISLVSSELAHESHV